MPEPLTPDERNAVTGPQTPGQRRAAARARRASARPRSASSTLLPRRAVAKRSSSARSRAGGSSAISALAASMRNFGLVVRAGGPRRSHASSLRSSCWRRSSRARRLAVALGAREHVGRVAALVLVDRAVGDLPRRGAHRVQEPAVVGHDQHRAAPRRQVARQPVDRLRRPGGWWARPAAAARGRPAAGARARRAGARRPESPRSACRCPARSAPAPRRPCSPSSTPRKALSPAHS